MNGVRERKPRKGNRSKILLHRTVNRVIENEKVSINKQPDKKEGYTAHKIRGFERKQDGLESRKEKFMLSIKYLF